MYMMDRKTLVAMGVIAVVLAVVVFFAGLFTGFMAAGGGEQELERQLAEARAKVAELQAAQTRPSGDATGATDTGQAVAANASAAAGAAQSNATAALAAAQGKAANASQEAGAALANASQGAGAALANATASGNASEAGAAPPPEEQMAKRFAIQAGAFLARGNAEKVAGSLQSKGYDPTVFVGEDERGRTWYVVRVGNYTEREEAFAAAKRFRQEVGVPAVVAYFDSLEAVAPDVEEVEQQTAETLYSVQVGSHLSAENANATMKDYAAKGYEACVMTIFDDRGKAWHVVQIGDFPSREEAETLGKRFKQQEGRPFSIKALDAALLKERKQCP